ncbi:DUF4058 family protein [Fortiea sp. LEGE XX443]|nr:DUF4058 family protein [Fortiea sp. LEGE XX443]
MNLQQIINDLYEQGSYDLRIDYARDPIPALSATDTVWLNELLHQQGLR